MKGDLGLRQQVMLAVPLIGLAVLATLFFVSPRLIPGDSASSAECMSHLKQLRIAGLMYEADFDDRLCPADEWMTLLEPLVRNETVYHCPKLGPRLFGYAMNTSVSAKAPKQLGDARTTLVLFESGNLSWNASGSTSSLASPGRHAGRSGVAYLDGHGSFVASR